MKDVDTLFLDTNLLIYAHDVVELTKRPIAQQLLVDILNAGMPCISDQVLSEFFWVATKKLKPALSVPVATAECNRLKQLCRVLPMDWDAFDKALGILPRHGTPLWDALIISLAKTAGAKIILSEDFQHRHTLEGVLFLNPFAPDFSAAKDLPN